jgi:hypothetical protein
MGCGASKKKDEKPKEVWHARGTGFFIEERNNISSLSSSFSSLL